MRSFSVQSLAAGSVAAMALAGVSVLATQGTFAERATSQTTAGVAALRRSAASIAVSLPGTIRQAAAKSTGTVRVAQAPPGDVPGGDFAGPDGPGGPGGPGGPPPPGGGSGPVMVATGSNVYVLVGHTIYAYDSTLHKVNSVDLPRPTPPPGGQQ